VRGEGRAAKIAAMAQQIGSDLATRETRADPRFETSGARAMPDSTETRAVAEIRYMRTVNEMANANFDREALIVGHGMAVGAVITAVSHESVYDLDFCGYVLLQRTISPRARVGDPPCGYQGLRRLKTPQEGGAVDGRVTEGSQHLHRIRPDDDLARCFQWCVQHLGALHGVLPLAVANDHRELSACRIAGSHC